VNDAAVKYGMTQNSTIFHIANRFDLAAIKQNSGSGASAHTTKDFNYRDFNYRCSSLSDEGFIHCCEKPQLAGVISRYFQNIDDIDLLVLSVDKLKPKLVHENTMGGSELFPHLYGPINGDAIIEIIPFGLDSDERRRLES